MDLETFRRRLTAHGALPVHVRRVLRLWSQGLPQDHGRRKPQDTLPAAVRAELPALLADLEALARVDSEHPAADGARRLLVRLADGQGIEAVLLPRGGLCVSTQVGCAVGCGFCMTGRSGLLRQLGSAEIVAQVALARRLRAVRKVVFMGMGEPAHNLDAVLDAVELLGTLGGLGHKAIVVSSVGDARLFERLQALPPGAVRPALALSLHSCDDARREALLPRAPRLPVAELAAAATRWARDSGYPLQVQWTLLAGLNDGDDELEGLVRLFAGQPAIVNFIPWNTVEGLPWRRPDPARSVTMVRALRERGVLATLRQSAAQDVDGGCGQLRARVDGAAGADAVPLRRIDRARPAAAAAA
ncbi:RNA methyltransferase [Piscinibacter sakaiensis]|uniref:Putative RNA methyltransferase PA1839 n=1 Tax=Piscinibacter sakaiensis TaxID=1547922 RepID=A0A0K8P069_PISS1|nr:RNA methyltransferase [Piscinibacter sakaiensis]GAP35934.1 putative RNA methyltransferase PA1839 [Piscinibacter sakaiensis]